MNGSFDFHNLSLNPVDYVLQFGVRYFQSRFSSLERVKTYTMIVQITLNGHTRSLVKKL